MPNNDVVAGCDVLVPNRDVDCCGCAVLLPNRDVVCGGCDDAVFPNKLVVAGAVAVLPNRLVCAVVVVVFPNKLFEGCAAADPPNNVPADDDALFVVPKRLGVLVIVEVPAPKSVPADGVADVVDPKRLPPAGLLPKRPPDAGCAVLVPELVLR